MKEIKLESVNNPKFRFNDKLVFVILLFISFLIVLPGIIAEWPVTHDVFRYVHLLKYFTDSILAGFYYPRWMPEVYGGYGYPTFVFYQPAVFYLATPFYLITGNPFTAYHIAMGIAVFAGGAGAYYLSKQITKDSIFAFIASVFYLLTPYLYVNLYVRGDLSEFLAMMLCPWPIFTLLKIKEKIDCNKPVCLFIGITAVFLAAIVYSHPFAGLMLFPTYVIFAIIIFDYKDKNKTIKYIFTTFSALILGSILSSPYWLPAVLMRNEVNYNWILSNYYVYDKHFVLLPQFFSNYWGYGDSMPGPEDYMSFQLGLFHFTIALLGILAGRKNRLILISGILYFFSIFLMTPWSGWLWKILPVIRMLQFPWRILLLTSLLQTICFCGIASLKNSKSPRFYFMAIIIFIMFICWNHKQFKCRDWSGCDLFERNDPEFLLEKEKESMSRAYYSFCNENEFLSKSVKTHLPPPRQNGPIINASSAVKELSIVYSPYVIKFNLTSLGNSFVRINQIYLPGWKVKVNGMYLDDKLLKDNLTPSGLMTIPLGKGYYEIEAWYDGPPWLLLRSFLVGIALILYISFSLYERKYFKAKDAQ